MSDELKTPTAQEATTAGITFSKGDPAARLASLKARADLMNISYSNNIGADTLAQKIENKLAGIADPDDQAPVELPKKSDAMRRMEMYNDNMKLVRLRISCLNPSKRDLPGEILTVSNRLLGTVRKFVQYGESTDEGFHVPYILYKFMKNRKFLSIKQVKDRRTNQMVKQEQWVSEYALEVLPQLTEQERQQLANRQAAANGMI